MKNTTTTTASAIAPILQSYINICGITQYVEACAGDFDVIEKIKCDYRLCNFPANVIPYDNERRARRFLLSSADFSDLHLPERSRVLVYCDKITIVNHARNHHSIFALSGCVDWCKRQAAAGHIVAVLDYFAPADTDCVCVWQSAPDKLGRTKKLFIFGGGNHAENTRS
jgi:hypothetical protein